VFCTAKNFTRLCFTGVIMHGQHILMLAHHSFLSSLIYTHLTTISLCHCLIRTLQSSRRPRLVHGHWILPQWWATLRAVSWVLSPPTFQNTQRLSISCPRWEVHHNWKIEILCSEAEVFHTNQNFWDIIRSCPSSVAVFKQSLKTFLVRYCCDIV